LKSHHLFDECSFKKDCIKSITAKVEWIMWIMVPLCFVFELLLAVDDAGAVGIKVQ
jgi:hypothetical protein